MLTVADRGEGGDKICQNLADVICERSLTNYLLLIPDKTPVLGYCCPNNNSLLSWSENGAVA